LQALDFKDLVLVDRELHILGIIFVSSKLWVHVLQLLLVLLRKTQIMLPSKVLLIPLKERKTLVDLERRVRASAELLSVPLLKDLLVILHTLNAI
jgi:hypothetical protein